MKNTVTLALMFLFLVACQAEDSIKRIKGDLELCQNIDSNRKIVAEFQEAEGTILAPGDCPVFTITGGPEHEERKVTLLAPCNLPADFQVENIQVVFSGYLYETFDTEDICAQIFELTSISRKN